MFFSFKEIVCVGNMRIFKKLERNIEEKFKKKEIFLEKFDERLYIFLKMWYTRNKLSANVFLKTKALNNIRRLNDEQRIIQKFI